MPTTETLVQSPTIGAIDDADLLWVWDASTSTLNKVSRLNLVGATITGGGTINLGGNTITAPASGGTLATLDVGVTAWTPTWSFSASGSVTYSARVGRYIVLNNLVFVWGFLRLSAISSPTGSASITGLPFTSSSTTNLFGSCSIMFLAQWGSDLPNLRGYVNTNSTSILFAKNASNVGAEALLGSDFASVGNDIMFSAYYLRA